MVIDCRVIRVYVVIKVIKVGFFLKDRSRERL